MSVTGAVMSNKIIISFGDNVRIKASQETEALELSGKIGQVFGETTPSVTGVEVIGNTTDDYAINVSIEEINQQFWFAPHLLELIDHGEGTEVVIGNHRAVRQADGSWEESEITALKKWWQFWK